MNLLELLLKSHRLVILKPVVDYSYLFGIRTAVNNFLMKWINCNRTVLVSVSLQKKIMSFATAGQVS